MTAKRNGKLLVAVGFAALSLLLVVFVIEAGLVGSANFAFASSLSIFCIGATITVLVSIIMRDSEHDYNSAATNMERRATAKSQHVIEGMRWVSGSITLLSGCFVFYLIARAALIDSSPGAVRGFELWVGHNAPYVLFAAIVGILTAWVKWTLPLFLRDYGERDYIAGVIFGVTIMMLSLFGISIPVIGTLYKGASNFVYVQEVEDGGWRP